MIIAKTRQEIKDITSKWKQKGLLIGLVPTMGYLHEGHESLIKRARSENDKVVVSDFVNPIQFGPNEDLATYPRDFEMDSKMCQNNEVDAIFYPSPEQMYDSDFSANVHISSLTEDLCGASRPGHFDGVCTVVNKLFNLSHADRAYFGEKDAQQLAVIRRMVRDLDMNVEVMGCPIVREEDGLAKSSRNVYLKPEDRAKAPQIHKALLYGRSLIEDGTKDVKDITDKVIKKITDTPGMEVDYVKIVSWDGIAPVNTIEGSVLLAAAIRLGGVRLIDNEIIRL